MFTGQRVKARVANHLRAPEGCGFIVGKFDRRAQRVDVALMEASRGDFSPPSDFVIAYSRPQQEVADEQRATTRRRARLMIKRLERAQLRPIRELALDPNNSAAKQRLQQIEDRIAAERAALTEPVVAVDARRG